MHDALQPCKHHYLITFSSNPQFLEDVHEGNHAYTAEILTTKRSSPSKIVKETAKRAVRFFKEIQTNECNKIPHSNIWVDGSTCCFTPSLSKLKHSCKTLIL